MRTYLFHGWFLCWWKLCLRDGLKQIQAPNSSASSFLQLYLFFVYRPIASQWWMGWERSTTFSPTTSRSGIGPWRLQPQVSIKWYIVNVPCYGFSGKTQQPYFNSVSFQNGNLIVSIIPFQWKLLIANIDTSDGSFSLPGIWDSSYIIKIYGEIVESFFTKLKTREMELKKSYIGGYKTKLRRHKALFFFFL